jgi:hypothetical protein
LPSDRPARPRAVGADFGGDVSPGHRDREGRARAREDVRELLARARRELSTRRRRRTCARASRSWPGFAGAPMRSRPRLRRRRPAPACRSRPARSDGVRRLGDDRRGGRGLERKREEAFAGTAQYGSIESALARSSKSSAPPRPACTAARAPRSPSDVLRPSILGSAAKHEPFIRSARSRSAVPPRPTTPTCSFQRLERGRVARRIGVELPARAVAQLERERRPRARTSPRARPARRRRPCRASRLDFRARRSEILERALARSAQPADAGEARRAVTLRRAPERETRARATSASVRRRSLGSPPRRHSVNPRPPASEQPEVARTRDAGLRECTAARRGTSSGRTSSHARRADESLAARGRQPLEPTAGPSAADACPDEQLEPPRARARRGRAGRCGRRGPQRRRRAGRRRPGRATRSDARVAACGIPMPESAARRKTRRGNGSAEARPARSGSTRGVGRGSGGAGGPRARTIATQCEALGRRIQRSRKAMARSFASSIRVLAPRARAPTDGGDGRSTAGSEERSRQDLAVASGRRSPLASSTARLARVGALRGEGRGEDGETAPPAAGRRGASAPRCGRPRAGARGARRGRSASRATGSGRERELDERRPRRGGQRIPEAVEDEVGVLGSAARQEDARGDEQDGRVVGREPLARRRTRRRRGRSGSRRALRGARRRPFFRSFVSSARTNAATPRRARAGACRDDGHRPRRAGRSRSSSAARGGAAPPRFTAGG